MIFSKKPSISEQILELLADGPINSLELLSKLQSKEKITKQGFYRALRELLFSEVITKNKQLVLLSPVWVNRAAQFIERLQNTTAKQGTEALLHLTEGDTMVFRFKSITDLYLLWTHYFFIFCKETDGPIVFFNNHNFWALFRSDIENEMYAWIKNNNKTAYSVIGNNSPLDRSTSDYINKDYGIEIAYEQSPTIKETAHPVVFGDYIMSTVLDYDTVNSIDSLYKKYKEWTPLVQTELEDIISKMKRPKVTIERNKKKAEQLRKKLLKYFIFYKSKSLKD